MSLARRIGAACSGEKARRAATKCGENTTERRCRSSHLELAGRSVGVARAQDRLRVRPAARHHPGTATPHPRRTSEDTAV